MTCMHGNLHFKKQNLNEISHPTCLWMSREQVAYKVRGWFIPTRFSFTLSSWSLILFPESNRLKSLVTRYNKTQFVSTFATDGFMWTPRIHKRSDSSHMNEWIATDKHASQYTKTLNSMQPTHSLFQVNLDTRGNDQDPKPVYSRSFEMNWPQTYRNTKKENSMLDGWEVLYSYTTRPFLPSFTQTAKYPITSNSPTSPILSNLPWAL